MRNIALFLLALFIMPSIYAMEAPRYLAVPGWKNCSSVIVRGEATFVCLPEAQPFNCPSASWKLLQNQKMIERCKT